MKSICQVLAVSPALLQAEGQGSLSEPGSSLPQKRDQTGNACFLPRAVPSGARQETRWNDNCFATPSVVLCTSACLAPPLFLPQSKSNRTSSSCRISTISPHRLHSWKCRFSASLNLLKSAGFHDRNGTSLIFSSQKRPIFYLEGGSKDQLLGGNAKSRGRAVADF